MRLNETVKISCTMLQAKQIHKRHRGFLVVFRLVTHPIFHPNRSRQRLNIDSNQQFFIQRIARSKLHHKSCTLKSRMRTGCSVKLDKATLWELILLTFFTKCHSDRTTNRGIFLIDDWQVAHFALWHLNGFNLAFGFLQITFRKRTFFPSLNLSGLRVQNA